VKWDDLLIALLTFLCTAGGQQFLQARRRRKGHPNARSDLDKMAAARDREAARRRRAEESVSVHRRIIIEAPCLGPDKLPPFPE